LAGDLDKLESELNEIKGTKVLVRRALVQNAVWFSNMFSFDNNTKEVNTKSDSLNCDVRHHRREVFDVGRYRRSDEIPVTSNVSTNYSDREKRRKKSDDRQAGRVVFKGANKKQFAVHVGFQL
jgi:hypothetical protein